LREAKGKSLFLTYRYKVTCFCGKLLTKVVVAIQVPFTIRCNGAAGDVPGALRWVTTSIARWDPLVEWPPDLTCKLVWNKELKTYDGERGGM
jgi:hypothetical protein